MLTFLAIALAAVVLLTLDYRQWAKDVDTRREAAIARSNR